MDRNSTPKYPVPEYDHSGLEAVPIPQLETSSWHHQQQDMGHGASSTTWVEPPQVANLPAEPRQRILGLSVKTFWILIVLLVVIIAGGVGGGVGGGLAARGSSALPAATSSAPSSPSAPATDPHQTAAPTGTSPTSTTNTPPSSTTSRAGSAVSPAPTDDGCPSINGTAYTPVDASGKAIPLQADGAAQTFRRLCDVNWPSGAAYGNPQIYDIAKLYLPSLEACIAACATYNVKFQENLASGAVQQGGLCRAVSIVKTAGEYCYLKNGTAAVDTFGQKDRFSSAALFSGAG